MGYLQSVDAWLEELLAPLPDEARKLAVKGIKAKILESYRNGAQRLENGPPRHERPPYRRRYRDEAEAPPRRAYRR